MSRIATISRKRRVLVVGDVHGCLRELDDLLAAAGFKAGQDRLVMTGDLLDRGPDSVGVLRRVRELRGLSVLGNHEEKHLRYRAHEARAKADPSYKIPMSKPHPETHDALSEADWKWLERLPLTIEIGADIVVVHGGFSRDLPRWRPRKNVCRVRYVHKDTRNFQGSRDGWKQPENTIFWTALYRGTRNVIFGHEPMRQAARDYRKDGRWTLGIDTACVFGRALTGYWVGAQRLVSVPAHRKWYAGRDDDAPKPVERVRDSTPLHVGWREFDWDWRFAE